jgi:2-C-methyl-D-erythritol 4-phosphate cytidylyltransferase
MLRTSLILRISWVLGTIMLVTSFVPSTMTTTPSRPSFVRHDAAAASDQDDETLAPVDMGDVGFVLLAGGRGSRMKANMPKQFMELKGAPILHHSLDLFLERLPAFLKEQGVTAPPVVVLVMDPSYQPEYQPIVDRYHGRLVFANPGVERQGSVENGLNQLVKVSEGKCQIAAIHDSARPLVTVAEVCNVVRDAKKYGAAVLGVPCKATIKESEDGETVLRTIPRARLWEVHTPQVIRIETLQRGFAKVAAEDLEVTDDVSIVEALGETVKLTLGEYTNLKITTPEDMDVASAILEERKTAPVDMLATGAQV